MSTELERMFVEGAARAAYVLAWVKREEHPPEGLRQIGWHDRTQEDVSGIERGVWCERQPQGHRAFRVWPATGDANADTLYLFDDEVDFDRPAPVRSFAGQELAEVAPPTPSYAREWAWKLLGVLEEVNPHWGRNLPSICAAAARADAHQTCPESAVRGAGHVLVHHDAQLSTDAGRAFGSDIAMMALGTGVSWFDSHASFELHVPDCSARGFELETEDNS